VLIKQEQVDVKYTSKLTSFDETALDLAIMLKTDGLLLAKKHSHLFDFNLQSN